MRPSTAAIAGDGSSPSRGYHVGKRSDDVKLLPRGDRAEVRERAGWEWNGATEEAELLFCSFPI